LGRPSGSSRPARSGLWQLFSSEGVFRSAGAFRRFFVEENSLKKILVAGLIAIALSAASAAGVSPVLAAAPGPMHMMPPVHNGMHPPMVRHHRPHKVCGWERFHHHRVWVCHWVRR
jgi:hypothetical protein